jgi:tripartite-type tricarboxylate transporter receptor subunit TctC
MVVPRRTLFALAAAAAVAPPGTALAQGFPSRPVTVIAAGAEGGPTDAVARILADAMGRHLGQPVVVEAIGPPHAAAQRLVRMRPDGYTLMLANVGLAASATLFRHLPYEIPGSFAPLGLVSDTAMTLVARPGFPAKDLAGYMEALRRGRDKFSFATAGPGSAANLCALLVQAAVGARAKAIVFRGTAPAIASVVAGRMDLLCDQATNTAPYIRDGRVQAYAVTSRERLPGLPDLPTTAEAGFPAIAMEAWHGLFAPAGTPEPVQEAIAAALRGALREEGLRSRFAELLTEPASEERATPAFHRRFLVEEVERWRPIIQAVGVYAD